MTGQPPLDDMRDLWQGQPTEPLTMQISEIRKRASKFEKKVNRRNLIEYIAAVFVVAAFSWYIVIFPNTIMRIGCGLIIAGTLFVVHQLRRKGSAKTLPGDTASATCLDFYRSELIRQRDLLRGVWLWYIGPFIPGFIVFEWGRVDMDPSHGQDSFGRAMGLAALLLTVIGLNWWVARRLKRQIDELDALGKEN